jgi:hypothetical protein
VCPAFLNTPEAKVMQRICKVTAVVFVLFLVGCSTLRVTTVTVNVATVTPIVCRTTICVKMEK